MLAGAFATTPTTASPPEHAAQVEAVDYPTDRAEQIAAYERADRHARDVEAQTAAQLAAQVAAAVKVAEAKKVAAQAKTATTQKKTMPAKRAAGSKAPPKQYGPVKAAGSLAVVVRFALAQQGKPYVFGASGPGSYDCSGLIVRSFAQIGIRLYHQSERMVAGRPAVARANWVPGTVLKYPGHVGLYVGNGKMVHASRAGKPVAVVSVYGSPTGYRIG